MIAALCRREVYEIPVAELGRLAAAGRVPELDPVLDTLGARGIERLPTGAELEGVRWFVARDGAEIVGVLAFRDEYDPRSSATIRKVLHLVGTARGVVELTRDLKACGLPVLGEIHVGNRRMRRFAKRVGFIADRVVVAFGGER